MTRWVRKRDRRREPADIWATVLLPFMVSVAAGIVATVAAAIVLSALGVG